VPRSLRAIASAAIALSLGAAGALGLATTASAADVATPDVQWDDVNTDALYIGDAGSYYADYFGVETFGWTSDAFDGFLSEFAVQYLADDPVDVTVTPVSATFAPNGLSTVIADGTAEVGDGITVSVDLTLEIQGSFARWSFDFSTEDPADLDDITVFTTGNLGSDNSTTFEEADFGLLSWDGLGFDPILAWQVETSQDGLFLHADGDDIAGMSFDAGPLVLTIGLQEYDPCNLDLALDTARDLLDDPLPFGTTLPALYTLDCVTPTGPVNLAINSPANNIVPVGPAAGFNPEWLDLLNGVWQPDAFTALAIDGLPAGLTLTGEVDAAGKSLLRVTGTATTVGTYSVHVFGYWSFDDDGNYYPAEMTLTITVGLPATGGPDALPIGIGAALLLLAGGAMLLTRRLERRAS
jgi:hypothetical protein